MNVETQSLIPRNSGLYQKLVWLWKAISLCDFLILLEILVSYFSDAFFDILLAIEYFNAAKWFEFRLTIIFIAFPHVFISVCSIFKCSVKFRSSREGVQVIPKESHLRTILRIAFGVIIPSVTW